MLVRWETPTHLNYGKRLWSTAVLLAGIHIAMAEAQVTDKVIIAMDEPCGSRAPNAIMVVLTVQNQTVRFPATRDSAYSPWTGVRPDGLTFSAKRAKASLRLKGTRTDCESSFAVANEKKEDFAKFIFHCNQRRVRNVKISTDGPIGVTYVRKNADCVEETENEYFKSGSIPYPVADMWIPGEELRLKLGWPTRNPADPGLLVFSLGPAAKDWPLFSSDSENSALLVVDGRGRYHRKKTIDALAFKRSDIVSAFVKQRFPKGWKLGGNPGDIEDKRLKDAGVKTITLTVQ